VSNKKHLLFPISLIRDDWKRAKFLFAYNPVDYCVFFPKGRRMGHKNSKFQAFLKAKVTKHPIWWQMESVLAVFVNHRLLFLLIPKSLDRLYQYVSCIKMLNLKQPVGLLWFFSSVQCKAKVIITNKRILISIQEK